MSESDQQQMTPWPTASDAAPPARPSSSLPLPGESETIDLASAERAAEDGWRQATPPYPPAVTPPGHPEAQPKSAQAGVDVLDRPADADGLFARFVPPPEGLEPKLAGLKAPRRIRTGAALPVVELVGDEYDDEDLVEYVPLADKLKPYLTRRNATIAAGVVLLGLLAWVIAINVDLSPTLTTAQNPTTTVPPTTVASEPPATVPFADAVAAAPASAVGVPAPQPVDAALAFASAVQYRNATLMATVLSPTANRSAAVAAAAGLQDQIGTAQLSAASFTCTPTGTTAQCSFVPDSGISSAPLRLEQLNGAWRVVF